MLVWSILKLQRGIPNEAISSDIVERECALVKAQICNVTVIIYFFPLFRRKMAELELQSSRESTGILITH